MAATASALTVTAFLCIGTPVIDRCNPELLFAQFRLFGHSVLWANPFYALASLTSWLTSGTLHGPEPDADPVVSVCYFLLALIATAAILAFMVRRYRAAVRERS